MQAYPKEAGLLQVLVDRVVDVLQALHDRLRAVRGFSSRKAFTLHIPQLAAERDRRPGMENRSRSMKTACSGSARNTDLRGGLDRRM